MKTRTKVTIAGFAVMAFIVLWIIIFRNLVPQNTAALSQTNHIESAYPLPGGTSYPIPSSAPFVYSSPTPQPGGTPDPTHTALSGSTLTPIFLIKPAKDASGTIFYMVKDEDNKLLKAFEVDSELKITTTPKQVSARLPEGTYYPSPDGKYIVILSGTESGVIGYLLEVHSGTLSVLLEDFPISAFFGWYPDSKQLLVSFLDYGLWLIDADGKKMGAPIYKPNLGGVTSAAASPDGEKIIYTSSEGITSDEPAHTWLASKDGSNAIEIMQTPYALYNLRWSPDGTKIAFLGDGLMVMDADGSNLHTLGHPSIPHCYLLNTLWSPDSQKLILPIVSTQPDSFCQGWDDSNFTDTNISIFDIQSGEYFTLPVEPGTGNIDPMWSPDSKKIIFVSNRGGKPDLWTIDVDGANLHQLTHDGQFVRFPMWQKP